MADHFTKFAVELTALTDAEVAWVVEALGWDPDEDPDAEDPPWWDDQAMGPGFDHELDRQAREVLLYGEESGNVECLAEFVLAFVVKFRPDEIVEIEWAETCSRTRAGEFGGGACVVSREGIEWMATSTWASRKVKEVRDRRAAIARDNMEEAATKEPSTTHITRVLVAAVARAYCDGDGSVYGDARTLLEDIERDVRTVLDGMPTLALDRLVAAALDRHAFDIPEETEDGV